MVEKLIQHIPQALLKDVIRQHTEGEGLDVLQFPLDSVRKQGDQLGPAVVQLLVIGRVGNAHGGQRNGKHQQHGRHQDQHKFCPQPSVGHPPARPHGAPSSGMGTHGAPLHPLLHCYVSK